MVFGDQEKQPPKEPKDYSNNEPEVSEDTSEIVNEPEDTGEPEPPSRKIPITR